MTVKTVSIQSAVILHLLLFSVLVAQPVPDTAGNLLRRGSTLGDSTLVKRAIAAATTAEKTKRQLFTGTCLYRLQAIAYVAQNKKATARYGKQALALLDSAEATGADTYSIHAVRAYVSQIMAGLGITYGPKYGPLIAKNHKVLKRLDSTGFDSRYIDYVNLVEMPKFIGGNPAKAVPLLEAFFREYPDSVAVGITLARSYAKTGNKEKSVVLLDSLLAEYPANAALRRELEGER